MQDARSDEQKGTGMKRKNQAAGRIGLAAAAVAVMALAIWGPEALADYRDKDILNQIHEQEVPSEGEGYRYRLGSFEKLHILSESLKNQTLPESEQSASAKVEAEGEYQDGTYAFIVNHKGPSGKEITDGQVFEILNQGLAEFMELGILPDTLREAKPSGYDEVLYSAIDVPEPQNNVAVWKVSLSVSQMNSDRKNRLIDAYLDADDGKIYEFYARTSLTWEEIDPDDIIDKWSGYMGLESPEPYEEANPLMESTPCYKKYLFSGAGGERTVVTVGFYEGINELFLRIS